jgi:predicted RNase H-like HicB family nuclease
MASGGSWKLMYMESMRPFTAVIERQGNGFTALCPELDVVSQGGSVEEARDNLREAIELFLESADRSEIEARLQSQVFTTRPEIPVDSSARQRRARP